MKVAQPLHLLPEPQPAATPTAELAHGEHAHEHGLAYTVIAVFLLALVFGGWGAWRVLAPAQFGAANLLLVAGADFSGMVVLQVTGPDAPAVAVGAAAAAASPALAALSSAVNPLRIAGYRVLAFYP